MARGVNKVILVGNLGKDPEIRYTASGSAVANIVIATSESWKDKQTGEKQEKTEWHRIVFFNRLAEVVGEYLKKGAQIYVEGRLQTRKWQDQSGEDRYTTEIVSSEMQMLGSKADSGSGDGYASQQHQDGEAKQPSQSHQQQGNAPQGGSQEASGQNTGQQTGSFDDFDDDIPY